MMSSQQHGSPLMAMKNELLHGAVVRGELPTVRRLLDRHRADIKYRNSKGLSCLQLAILNGHTKLGEFLIQKGVDIHMADPEGYTALHDAAVMENTLLVRKLISKGLSPLLTTANGELVIDVAGSLHMEKLLCEEMCISGDISLAREYYDYLRLGTHDTERSLISYGCHSHPPRSHSKHQGGPVGCKSSLGAHTPSPKSEARKLLSLQTDCQVSRNMPTRASRVHPSAKIANSSQIHPDPEATSAALRLGHLPNSVSNSPGNHRNAVGVSEQYKEDTEGTESASSSQTGGIATEKVGSSRLPSPPSSSPPTTTTTSLQAHQDLKPTGKLQLPPPTACESNQITTTKSNLSSQQVRAAAAIKALQQHNSFQLQIGLSLQAQQFSSFDEEEEYFAADCNSDDLLQLSSSLPVGSGSKLSLSNSPRPIYRSQSIQPDWFLTSGGQQQQQQHHRQTPNRPSNSPRSRRSLRPLTKSVSFADLPMTRSKPMFVGEASNPGSGTATTTTATTATTAATTTAAALAKERRSNSVCHSLSFSTNVLDRYISNYNPTRAKEAGSDEVDSMFDAGIRALQLKPRKSSIMRRHNSEGGLVLRRRSVTFQPEVLLQEVVTAGDVKAVSEILESGMIEDVNKMSPSGLTALHQSAIDGNLECAKTLVGKGADVNCTDCEKWTPLHAAVMNGSVQFVRFLIASGANPNFKNDSGETAYDMAKSGPIRKMLLNTMNGRGPDADEYSDGEYSGEEEEEYSHAESESDDELEGEDSGLFDANVGEKTSLKERLGLTHTTSVLNNCSVHSNSITPSPDLDNVFSGGQIYHRRDHDLTDSTSSYGSLFEATDDKLKELDKNYTTRTSTCTKISNIESDTDKISESGISTMEGSSDGSHRGRMLSSEDEAITMDSDLEPDSLEYEFQEACLFCDVDRVMKLVKCKPDIDVDRVNKASGITALHHCVLEENYALVQHLVRDFEADIHVQDIEGWTPLHAASAVGSIQIAQFLLDKGAKPSSLNLSCEFPVDVAEDEAMEKLLKKAMLGQSSESGLKR